MRDLIVFGEDFGGLPSSTQHLITRLADVRKILWVNSIGLRQPKLNRQDVYRAWNKLFGGAAEQYLLPENHLHPNITVINLHTIPAPSSDAARWCAKTLMRYQLNRALRTLKLHQPILWTSLPTAADLCGELGESAVVYYCGDDFSALSGVDHQVVAEHERRLVHKANLVIAASDTLQAQFPAEKSRVLTHGVDLELFTRPAPKAQDMPSTGKPSAGFYGSLEHWLDYSLLSELCEKRADWDFVFVGPIRTPHYPLPQLSNVHYLGPKPFHLLPQYSQHWDVALLPFLPNQQIQACNPLKLREYLATGTRVISTPFPALDPYRHYVNVARNADEFSNCMDLETTTKPIPKKLLQGESWNQRSEQLNNWLEAL
ncbi:glycosyltransferase family 1 protein [Vibrio proteolyticus]|uniref:Glycosyltransferase n=1 Tax=Vibrio proteolyticus NBRC 13287 TaxID=1219065 RepID=U3B681_VIBPR|nr:glycosyltransferase family 1 protein [Vibrio proteolyticus]GAD65344.1 hypothetical protein VPR01S_01_01160 [Vibrio proteolyticus NBRC 13287]